MQSDRRRRRGKVSVRLGRDQRKSRNVAITYLRSIPMYSVDRGKRFRWKKVVCVCVCVCVIPYFLNSLAKGRGRGKQGKKEEDNAKGFAQSQKRRKAPPPPPSSISFFLLSLFFAGGCCLCGDLDGWADEKRGRGERGLLFLPSSSSSSSPSSSC